MSLEVGGVHLSVNLDSKPVVQQANAMQGQLERSFSGIGRKLGAALVGAFSVRAFTSLAKKTAQVGDTIDKMSQKLGMSADAYQQWDFILDHCGASIESLQTGMKTLSGAAVTGKKVFDRLGLSQESIARMSQEELFSATITALQKVTDTTERTYLAGQLLGRGATELGPLLNMSAEETEGLRRQLYELGGVMSGRAVKNAAAFQDALTDIRTAGKGIYNTFAEYVLPGLTRFIYRGVIPAIQGLNSLMGALVKTANTFKSFVFSLFGKESEDMAAGAGASVAALGDTVGEAMAGAEEAAAGASDGLSDVGDAATGAAKDAKKAAQDAKRSLASFDVINKLSDASSGNSGSSGNSSGGGSGAGNAVSGALGDTSSALKGSAYEVGSDGGPLDKLTEKLQRLKDLFVGGFWKGFGDAEVLQSIQGNLSRIGDAVSGIFNDEQVQGAAQRYLEALATSLGQQAGALVSIGATVADNLTGGMANALEQNRDRITGFLVRMFDISAETERIKGDFAQAVAEVFSVFRSDDAKQITADLLTLLWEGFSGLTELGAKVGRDTLDALTRPFLENKDKLKEALENTLGPVRTVLDGVVGFVQRSWDSIQALYDEHIRPLIQSLTGGVSEIIGTLLDGYNQSIAPVLDKLADKATTLWTQHLSPAVDSILGALGALADLAKTLWETILQPFLNWAAEKVMPILAPIVELLGSAFLKAIADAADKVQALADWVKAAADALSALAGAIPDLGDIKKRISDSLGAFMVKISAFFSDKKEDLTKKWNELTENVKDKTADLKAWVATKWSDLSGAWKGITDNVKDKTADMKARVATKWGDLSDAWKNITNNIKDKTADMKARVATKWGDLKKGWEDLLGNFKDKTVSVKLKIAATVNNLKKWFNSKVIDKVNSAIHKVPLLKNVSIPHLAQGGYVRKNTPQLAMIGDNRHQGEIVAPEGKLLAMAKEAAAAAGGTDPQVLALLVQLLTAVKAMSGGTKLYLDGRVVTENTLENLRGMQRDGREPLAGLV